ncbi:hypothetical protein SDC9_184286 [bioreactor metagenome]|uniref:Uncharacterized protein n=1 Tax=bioreactor metagenome TaxID=1076179 RepID=A0A645HCL7_9ZZZZ
MGYISEIFERANIQHIREFLLNGGELLEVNPAPYEQRLADDLKKALGMVQAYIPEEHEQIQNTILQAVSSYEDVYMEIGLQVGIRLAMQIYNSHI